MKSINKINVNLILLVFAFIVVFFKVFLSYFYYPGEDEVLKQLSELIGSQYFPIIKSYSELNFSPSYELGLNNEKNLAFPFLPLFFHSFFLKLFGINSFILIELIASTIFLIIFFHLLKLLNFTKSFSIFLSITFFLIPNLFNELRFFDLDILNMISQNLMNIYGARLPRPLITNLYFFFYLLIILKIYIDKNFTIRRAFLLGLISGICLHSFYYFSLIQFFLTILTILILNQGNLLNHLSNNKGFYFILILTNLFFLILLIININNTSFNNLNVLGFHSLNFDQKFLLIKSFVKYVLNKYFIFLFVINLILFFYIKKLEKNLLILYVTYISSIISFLFFIIISNKSTHYYFFQHWILITGFIFFVVSISKVIESKIFFNFKKKIYFFLPIIFLFLIINNIVHYKNYDKNDQDRIDTQNLLNFVKSDIFFENKEIKILTFDNEIFTILAIKNYNDFILVPNSFWTVRSKNKIENDLINSFKLLKLDTKHFSDFFKSKIKDNRFINKNTSSFFGMAYLANSMITYNDKKDYSSDEIEKIIISSPFQSEQLIIPKSEMKRMKSKFEKSENFKIKPELIIINKNSFIGENYTLNPDMYCQNYVNDTFVVYKNTLYCN